MFGKIICIVITLSIVCPQYALSAVRTTKIQDLKPVILSHTGKKVSLPNGMYFLYTFSTKPALGSTILKITIFSSQGKKINNLEIVGKYGMPLMAGAHDSGDVLFQVNKKGDYLLPIDIVMPGEWEVSIDIKQKTTILFKGKIIINV